jgi:hypothetical protein
LISRAQPLANDIYQLNPELSGWVLHVMCFIVPRQIVELGEPARRACDACEAIGSVCKKLIRHNTCRRRVSQQQHAHRSSNGRKLWTQTFKKGYVTQMFKRISVRADLIHGEANERYLQRADHRLKQSGKSTVTAARDATAAEREPRSVREAMEVPWVWTEEAALALWS